MDGSKPKYPNCTFSSICRFNFPKDSSSEFVATISPSSFLSVLKLAKVIPATLDADIKKQAKVYYMKHQCNQETVDTKHRSYPIHFTARGESEILEICDMPTILNGIDKAIDMYFRIGHIGKTNEQQLTEDRELGSFARVLKLLIEQ